MFGIAGSAFRLFTHIVAKTKEKIVELIGTEIILMQLTGLSIHSRILNGVFPFFISSKISCFLHTVFRNWWRSFVTIFSSGVDYFCLFRPSNALLVVKWLLIRLILKKRQKNRELASRVIACYCSFLTEPIFPSVGKSFVAQYGKQDVIFTVYGHNLEIYLQVFSFSIIKYS